MDGYVNNIERETLDNENFRRVLYTTEQLQLVVMALRPGEEIGRETHDAVTQFIRVEYGRGRAELNGESRELNEDDAVIVPPGVEHNVINTGNHTMKLYTLYSPPEHAAETVHRTRAEAEAEHHAHH